MRVLVPRTLSRPRPAQGARLLALRQAAGLSQTELAKSLAVPQTTIALWERSEKPPRSDVLPKMAKIFEVDVSDLIVSSNSETTATKPVGRLQTTIAELRELPRRQQERILDVISALVQQSKAAERGQRRRSRA